MSLTYKVVAVLLTYPEQGWVAHLDDLRASVAEQDTGLLNRLEPLLSHLAGRPLLELQETYVATFDLNPDHALYLFHHLYGDSPDRGTALSELFETYRRHGLESTSDELPDFLPRYLEFLSYVGGRALRQEVTRAQPVIATLSERLSHAHSPYAAAFDTLDVVMAGRRPRWL